MTQKQSPTPAPLVAGALAAGLIGWAWSSDWRWAVTGLAVAIVLGGIGAALDASRGRGRRDGDRG